MMASICGVALFTCGLGLISQLVISPTALTIFLVVGGSSLCIKGLELYFGGVCIVLQNLIVILERKKEELLKAENKENIEFGGEKPRSKNPNQYSPLVKI